jgi:hypothetical protein
MNADSIKALGQLGICSCLLGNFPLVIGRTIHVAAHNLHVGEAARVQGAAQPLDPRRRYLFFVPATDETDVETVELFCALDEAGQLIGHVLRAIVPVTNPAGRTPRQAVQDDLRVPLPCLFH